MKFVHLLSRITGTAWLIEEAALTGILSLIDARIEGIALQPVAERVSVSPNRVVQNGIATIPIQGVIGKRLSPLEMACGGCDIDELERAFDTANADPAIAKIVLAIDSPGGTVTGVPELAAKILATKSKPVEARSDTLIGSAAYYLAAAADTITVTPTTVVGSIGVALVVKENMNAEKDGTRLRVFRSGADKLPGVDGPLSKEQATHLESQVAAMGADFRSFVSACRPGITASTMTGLTYRGREAMKLGLVDHICETATELATAA